MLETIPSTTTIAECEVLQSLVQRLPLTAAIVELGTGLGRTACALGMACAGTDRRVFSIDNFSERNRYEKWLHTEHPRHSVVRWTGATAKESVEKLGLTRYVTLLDGDSSDWTLLDGWPLDMVWIDAGHTYDAVRADILAWQSRVATIICGHDYDIPDVARAVDELLPTRIDGRIWICEKP